MLKIRRRFFFFPQFRALPSFIYLQAGSGDAKSPVHMQSFTSQPLQSKSEGRKVVSVNCDEDNKEKFEVLGKCMDQASARVQKPRKIFLERKWCSQRELSVGDLGEKKAWDGGEEYFERTSFLTGQKWEKQKVPERSENPQLRLPATVHTGPFEVQYIPVFFSLKLNEIKFNTRPPSVIFHSHLLPVFTKMSLCEQRFLYSPCSLDFLFLFPALKHFLPFEKLYAVLCSLVWFLSLFPEKWKLFEGRDSV